jgi:hypothetical protein
MLFACVCGRLAKQCWLAQEGTAGLTAHEQPEKSSGTVLEAKRWPENTRNVVEHFGVS